MGWWSAYAKAKREIEVAESIRALGLDARVALKVEAIRRGKKRWAEPVTTPLLPNIIFIRCTDEEWHLLRGVKGLAHTMHPVPTKLVERRHVRLRDGTEQPYEGLMAFIERAEEVHAARMAEFEATQRLSEFQEGDLLEILGGPLAGQLARFRKLVETAHDAFPRIKADLALMGGTVAVDLDPLHARKAG